MGTFAFYLEMKTMMISVDELQTHPANEMLWKKTPEDIASLERTIRETGHITALVVCPRAEGGYYVLSGDSRLAVARAWKWSEVNCEVTDPLSENEQILRIIAYNTGHAADKPKLVEAACNYRRKFPTGDLKTLLRFAGVTDERWKKQIESAAESVAAASPKNAARATANAADAASNGVESLEAANKRSEKARAASDKACKSCAELQEEVDRLTALLKEEKSVSDGQGSLINKIEHELQVAADVAEAVGSETIAANAAIRIMNENGFEIVGKVIEDEFVSSSGTESEPF